MGGRIPISAAKNVAHQYGLKQCLLLGWDGERAYVVTYGRTVADCEAAAKAQDFWTGRIREFSFTGASERIAELEKRLGDIAAFVCPPPMTRDGVTYDLTDEMKAKAHDRIRDVVFGKRPA